MPSLSTGTDYFRAVQHASRGHLARYPAAVRKVLTSRFHYDIGPRLFSLFSLFDVPEKEWSNYLVDERLRLVLRRINRPEDRELVNNKLAFHDHCLDHGLPTIPILCSTDRTAENEGMPNALVRTRNNWETRLHDVRDSLFLKLIDGTWGMDAFIAERVGSQWTFCGETGSTGELYDFSMRRLGDNRGWIVQPVIRAHSQLQQIASSSALPTMRAITCLEDDKATIVSAVLRIPVGGNVTDNFAHGTSGNLLSPIDLKTGKLGVCRGSARKSWPYIINVDVHPDTGGKIPGSQVPYWDDICGLLEQAQRSLPQLKTLGWDVAITNQGPMIVEANATYDVDLIQVAHQAGIAPVLQPWLGRINI